MKKTIIFVALALFLIACNASNQKAETPCLDLNEKEVPNIPEPKPEPEPDPVVCTFDPELPVSSENWPAHLPQHEPGDIELECVDVLMYDYHMPFVPQHRAIFYNMGPFIDMYENWDAVLEWSQIDIPLYIMPLAQYIQHFNITREQFDGFVEEMLERIEQTNIWSAERGIPPIDLNYEMNEIPNADIVFTFDNDIISYFYRRE